MAGVLKENRGKKKREEDRLRGVKIKVRFSSAASKGMGLESVTTQSDTYKQIAHYAKRSEKRTLIQTVAGCKKKKRAEEIPPKCRLGIERPNNS